MRIDRAFQGTLLSTGGFAAVALFNTPFTVVLGKVLVILTTVACIAGIAMIAKKKGLIEASLTEAPKSGV